MRKSYQLIVAASCQLGEKEEARTAWPGAAALYLESFDGEAVADILDAGPAFHTAKQHVERTFDLWDWEENVEFLGLSWVQIR